MKNLFRNRKTKIPTEIYWLHIEAIFLDIMAAMQFNKEYDVFGLCENFYLHSNRYNFKYTLIKTIYIYNNLNVLYETW